MHEMNMHTCTNNHKLKCQGYKSRGPDISTQRPTKTQHWTEYQKCVAPQDASWHMLCQLSRHWLYPPSSLSMCSPPLRRIRGKSTPGCRKNGRGTWESLLERTLWLTFYHFHVLRYIYMHMIFSPCIYDHWLLLELWEVLSKGHHENHPNEGLDWFGCDAAKKWKSDWSCTYSRSYI